MEENQAFGCDVVMMVLVLENPASRFIMQLFMYMVKKENTIIWGGTDIKWKSSKKDCWTNLHLDYGHGKKNNMKLNESSQEMFVL